MLLLLCFPVPTFTSSPPVLRSPACSLTYTPLFFLPLVFPCSPPSPPAEAGRHLHHASLPPLALLSPFILFSLSPLLSPSLPLLLIPNATPLLTRLSPSRTPLAPLLPQAPLPSLSPPPQPPYALPLHAIPTSPRMSRLRSVPSALRPSTTTLSPPSFLHLPVFALLDPVLPPQFPFLFPHLADPAPPTLLTYLRCGLPNRSPHASSSSSASHSPSPVLPSASLASLLPLLCPHASHPPPPSRHRTRLVSPCSARPGRLPVVDLHHGHNGLAPGAPARPRACALDLLPILVPATCAPASSSCFSPRRALVSSPCLRSGGVWVEFV